MSQHQFLSFVTTLLPWWRTSQRRVLALAVPAMVLRPRATLSGLARALPATAKLAYRLERLGRSVSNPRLDLAAGWAALAHRATSLRPTGWLPPPLDDTALREGLMWAPATELGAHRERLVVLADRGSAVSRVFRWCRHPKVRLHFVVRLLAKVHVQWEGFKTLLSSLEVEPGSWLWLPQLRYGPERALPNVLVVWRHGCKGPWRPASSLEDPRAIYRLYRRRMRIEALFKDAKGYFWPEECWRRRGGRLSTLSFVLSLALWRLALVVPASPQWYAQVRLRGRLSWLRQALEWIEQMMQSALLEDPPHLPLPIPGVSGGG